VVYSTAQRVSRRLKIGVVSDLTRRKLEGIPENVKRVLSSLPDTYVENVFLTEEAETLARIILMKES
jgi:hypothetical protein